MGETVSISQTRRGRGPEAGFALVSAIVFLGLVLVLGASLVEQVVQEQSASSRSKRETAAFNLAEAGIDYAAWKLYNEAGTGLPVTWARGDLGTGSFSVTADRFGGSSTTLALTSTGTAQGWTSQVKVIGKFMTTGVTGQNPVFDSALFSDSDLNLSGSFDITGDVHANGNVTVQGSANVDGNLSAVGSVQTKGNPNITGEQHAHVPRVGMPTIDLQHYRSIATTILTGDSSLTGTTELNGVTFIDGNVTINSNFKGKGVIVVTGNVTINGNALLTQEGDEFAVVSAGSVRINGNCRIEGWIYTHSMDVPSPFEGNGSAEVTGGVAADTIAVNGNLTIAYKTPTVELPGASTAPAQFDAVSWRRVR